MKLYTEEQIRQAWNTAYTDALSIDEPDYKPKFYDDFIQSVTPIELPTYEEVVNKFNAFINLDVDLGFLTEEQGERLKWYYELYFVNKIQGGNK